MLVDKVQQTAVIQASRGFRVKNNKYNLKELYSLSLAILKVRPWYVVKQFEQTMSIVKVKNC